MTNMGTLPKIHSDLLWYVYGAIFLNVAPVLDDNLSPITTNHSARCDVNISTNGHVSHYGCLGMDKGCLVNNRPKTLELENVAHGHPFSQ
jgi:hypothetical protein